MLQFRQGGEIILDNTIVLWLNRFVGQSAFFDRAVCGVNSSDLFRGVFITCLYWWALFGRRERLGRGGSPDSEHHHLAFFLLLSVPTVSLARALANLLPFRTRPLLDALLELRNPCPSLPLSAYESWNSMPSDHAVLFALLAAGLWFESRPIGLLAACHVMLFIWFPRVYMGIHWPSDILVGALFGLTLACLARVPIVRLQAQSFLKRWRLRFPGFYYASLFLVGYEVASLFIEPRHLLNVLRQYVR